MQVFSDRVLCGPEPDSTRTWIFLNARYPTSRPTYLTFHTRSPLMVTPLTKPTIKLCIETLKVSIIFNPKQYFIRDWCRYPIGIVYLLPWHYGILSMNGFELPFIVPLAMLLKFTTIHLLFQVLTSMLSLQLTKSLMKEGHLCANLLQPLIGKLY